MTRARVYYILKLNIRFELIYDCDHCLIVRRSLLPFIRSIYVRTNDISSAKRVHIVWQWLRVRPTRLRVPSQTPDDNKDNNSILLPTFTLSPFSSARHFLAWHAPFRSSLYTMHRFRAVPLIYLMHRGITKRISDLNTGDIMRKIKLPVVSRAGSSHERDT